MSTVDAQQRHQFAAVDGLRGLACLSVVIHHCYVHCGKYQWLTFNLAGRTTALSRALAYGNGGVELFFIVSGFCLAWPFVSRPNAEPWKRWFLRRAYRILPPYYASVLIFWGLYSVLHRHPFALFGMRSPPTGAIQLKGVVVCVTLINAYFNPSYWTLVLEARWYLVFPLLMALWRRSGPLALLCSSLAACAASLWLARISPHFVLATGQLLSFLPIFAAGILIARWIADGSTPPWLVRCAPWGLLASILLVAVAVPSDGSDGPLPPVLPWGLVAFFALLSILTDQRFSRVARTPALVGVGAFSYSLYLIHEPIVHLAYAFFQQRKPTPATQFLVYECGLVPLCIGVGYLFYCLVERPLVQRGRTLFKPVPVSVVIEPLPSNQ